MTAPTPTNNAIPLAEGDSAPLRAYVHDKQAVARHVRALEQWLRQRKADDRAGVCHELMVKLAEDRFTLAVVGQFKRGKSSLMNALIGRDLLPTGILPLTSAITILRFGPRERLVIRRDNWSIDEEAPVADLPQYVTELGNPGNTRKIKAAYVEFPSPFLRRGLEFVDTPGIGSAIEANTATTYGFIPQCDAVLFVTSADGPLATVELEFLQRIRQHVRKVFFVVNKMDLLAPPERQEVLRFIADHLSRQVSLPDKRLFAISSRLGLSAKEGHDRVKLAESGLPDLEAALAEFLTAQRSQTFLAAILDRAEELLATEQSRESLEQRTAIGNLRDRILGSPGAGAPLPGAQPAALPQPAHTLPVESPKSIQESVLIKALHARSCPVCKHLSGVLFDFFAHWQRAMATDEATQRVFAEQHGFCPMHTWQLAAISSPQGLSIGCSALVGHLAADLSALAAGMDDSRKHAAQVAALTSRSATCRACRLLAEAERDCTLKLATVVGTPSGREAYSSSQGVCLRHLVPLIAAVQDGESRRFLLGHAARRFGELLEDMQSFAIKHDATRRYLENRDETDAYLRALIQVAGQKTLCFPWRLDEV